MPCNTRPTRATQVTKAIGCPHLDLVQGEGYWYFVFDDPARNLYQTKSVMVNRLYKLSLLSWIEEGDELVKAVEQGYTDRQERETELAKNPARFAQDRRPYQQAAIDALRSPLVADAAKVIWMRNTGPLAMLRDWLVGAESQQIKDAAWSAGMSYMDVTECPQLIGRAFRRSPDAQPSKAADAYLARVVQVVARHPDAADAAWFLIDRTTYGHTVEFAAHILRDTTSAGIVSDARRHGFNPESDRRQFSGRVVPWELIDAAKAVTIAASHDAKASAIERLRKALKDL